MSQLKVPTLALAMLSCGIATTLTIQTTEYGLAVGIRNDKKRQKLLNLLCLFGSIAGCFVYPVNYMDEIPHLSSFLTFVMFVSIQYSLCIINHNSFVRLAILTRRMWTRTNLILLIYVLPLFTLIPIYLAAYESIPINKRLNLSNWNSSIYKPLNIVLVISTELVALGTDILMLRRLKQKTTLLLKKMYCITWIFLTTDIVIKYLISIGVPMLFDSILSLVTLAMRARVNLQFGLLLQKAVKPLDEPSDDEDGISTRLDLKLPSIMLEEKELRVNVMDFSDNDKATNVAGRIPINLQFSNEQQSIPINLQFSNEQ
jgi:hypothetical protein